MRLTTIRIVDRDPGDEIELAEMLAIAASDDPADGWERVGEYRRSSPGRQTIQIMTVDKKSAQK